MLLCFAVKINSRADTNLHTRMRIYTQLNKLRLTVTTNPTASTFLGLIIVMSCFHVCDRIMRFALQAHLSLKIFRLSFGRRQVTFVLVDRCFILAKKPQRGENNALVRLTKPGRSSISRTIPSRCEMEHKTRKRNCL